MSGCCRIDPIHHRGIYIPHSLSRSLSFFLARLLYLSLSFIPSVSFLSWASIPAGFPTFLKDAYAATCLSCACATTLFFIPSPRCPPYQEQRPLSTRQFSTPPSHRIQSVYFSFFCLHIQDSNAMSRRHSQMRFLLLCFIHSEKKPPENLQFTL